MKKKGMMFVIMVAMIPKVVWRYVYFAPIFLVLFSMNLILLITVIVASARGMLRAIMYDSGFFRLVYWISSVVVPKTSHASSMLIVMSFLAFPVVYGSKIDFCFGGSSTTWYAVVFTIFSSFVVT